ncbi:MAG: hypothetical protein HGA87_01070 [Desulfobulbaceae bacterium]|nr:hypothetical protein [Desulfobulbaceae bacterium]
MKPHELIKLRKQLGLSRDEASRGVLAIPKSTYARYEDGSAIIPMYVPEKLIQFESHYKSWKKDLKKRLDADIKKRFPFGIISELEGI